ncbi:MAG: STAS domain-containing protein [Armatimonadota bacterium]
METTIYYPEQHPGVTVVEVHGDVEAGECGSEVLCRLINSAIAGGDRWLVVDLAQVGRMAEEAVAQLLAVYGRLRLRGGEMLVVSPPGELLRLLNTVGLGKLTLILDDLDTAVQQAALRAGADSE